MYSKNHIAGAKQIPVRPALFLPLPVPEIFGMTANIFGFAGNIAGHGKR